MLINKKLRIWTVQELDGAPWTCWAYFVNNYRWDAQLAEHKYMKYALTPEWRDPARKRCAQFQRDTRYLTTGEQWKGPDYDNIYF